MKKHILLASLLAALGFASTASAQIRITEVHPTGSSAAYGADWFELLNTGGAAVNITGWKMDDNSNAFGSAVGLRGLSSIAPGQLVVFIEGNTSGSSDLTVNSNFVNSWFGGTTPAGVTIANYGGSGVSLGATGDAVNIYDGTGTLMANVVFGVATNGVSFDNSALLNNATISQLSVAGVNGAFAAGGEIGSPGAVPEPSTLAIGGLALSSILFRRRQ